MYEFAYRFVDAHRQQMSAFASYREIVSYLRRQDIVQTFVRYAEQKGVKRRNLMIRTSHDLIFEFLAFYIISDLLDTRDVVEYVNQKDAAVKKALEIIKEKKTFPAKEDDAVK